MKSKIFRCTRCLNTSNRPRIEFNEKGECNACQWADEKQTTVNWDERQEQLKELLNTYRNPDGYDCLVPVSGGKDSSYVSYKLKYEWGMNPLCITINPPLPFPEGEANLKNFVKKGFDLLALTPNPNIMQKLCRVGLFEAGQSLLGWQIALQTAIARVAVAYKIPLIFYGEDGEVEYGGTTKTKNQMCYDMQYAKDIYLSGNMKYLDMLDVPHNQLIQWIYPSDEDLKNVSVKATHWSYFENWDSSKNAELAIREFGLITRKAKKASYVDFAQNDTPLYDLHAYLMFLKFGFGRATQDAGIDIRRGAMTREEGFEMVAKYDEVYPDQYIQTYLDYYRITKEELDAIFDKWANKELLHKVDGVWKKKEEIY